jgi:hypothetical protein
LKERCAKKQRSMCKAPIAVLSVYLGAIGADGIFNLHEALSIAAGR